MKNNQFINQKVNPSKIKELYFYDYLYQREVSKRQREYIIKNMFDKIETMTKKQIKETIDEYLEQLGVNYL